MSSMLPWICGFLLAFLLFRRFVGKADPAAARQLVAEGALLLDVRSGGEFASGHLPGAVHVPLAELSGRLRDVGSDKARPIVVYCASGIRSATAASQLRGAGYGAVHDLGAMSRWPS